MAGDIIRDIDAALADTGLFVRGAFHPAAEDGVRPLADGRAPQTVVLIGNAGPALWRAVRRDNAELAGEHPLDRWVDAHLDRVAAEVGAEVVYATRKPWPPIQRWALKAGGVFRSPIGILIHPGYGLWHVYRGALLFAERLELPSTDEDGTGMRGSPCELVRRQALPHPLPGRRLLARGLRCAGLRRPCREPQGQGVRYRRLPGAARLPGRPRPCL